MHMNFFNMHKFFNALTC